MYGTILGDIIGSTYEYSEIKRKDFPLFPRGSDITDDSIMAIAVARALLEWKQDGGDLEVLMVSHMQALGQEYPHPMGAYGFNFNRWLRSRNPEPYYSCGNGSAMRAGACGLLARDVAEALELAEASAVVTHNHPEGIKGAQATAAAIAMAKQGCAKEEIRDYIHTFFYPMTRTCEEIRKTYRFEPTCQKTVPEAITAFLESVDFEDAIRTAISLGGDADTIGAITGAIAWTYYRAQNGGKLTEDMEQLKAKAQSYMPRDFIETAEEIDALAWK